MKIIEMNAENSNKPIFHKTKFYNNRTKLELKSIDLIASQDIKLNKLLSSFDQIARDKNKKATEPVLVDDLTKRFLKTNKIGETAKIQKSGPAYLVKKELQQKRESVLKPKKSLYKPKEKKLSKTPSSEKVEESKQEANDIIVTDLNLVIMDNDKMKYKNIEIDLNKNEVELKNSKRSEASDEKLSILSASESLETTSKDDGSKMAKSFLERFFDREPLSDSNTQIDETLKSQSLAAKESNKIEDDPKEPQDDSKENLNENVNCFIDKFFNYKPNRSLSERSSSAKIQKQASIDDKLQSLNNLKVNDPKLVKIILNYTSAYETLNNPNVSYFINNRTSSNCTCIQNYLECCLKKLYSTHDTSLVDKCCNECVEFKKSDVSLEILDDEYFDKIYEASNLLSNNEFNRFMKNFKSINSKSDCCCHLTNNKFKCCIENLFDKLVINEYDAKLEEFACCTKCLKMELSDKKESIIEEKKNKSLLINQKSIEEDLLETSEIDIKRISLMRKSLQESFEVFFKQANKGSDDKMDEIQSLKIDGYDVLNKPQQSSTALHSPIQSLTPRKTIIKNPKPEESRNLNKKSVTFFEDPKYGFRVVEIPDWLEHLRDPVYSKSFNKSRNEWKN